VPVYARDGLTVKLNCGMMGVKYPALVLNDKYRALVLNDKPLVLWPRDPWSFGPRTKGKGYRAHTGSANPVA